jgi:hypothetical protein
VDSEASNPLMVVNYHHSGQHDDGLDEQGSQKVLKWRTRAAQWKPVGSTSIIRYTSSMIYSISVLDLRDFEVIGEMIPKGNGVDATVDKAAKALSYTKRCKHQREMHFIRAVLEKHSNWEMHRKQR